MLRSCSDGQAVVLRAHARTEGSESPCSRDRSSEGHAHRFRLLWAYEECALTYFPSKTCGFQFMILQNRTFFGVHMGEMARLPDSILYAIADKHSSNLQVAPTAKVLK